MIKLKLNTDIAQRSRRVDAKLRTQALGRLAGHVGAYEGDMSVHIMDGHLLIIMRNEDKELVAYDCTIDRSGTVIGSVQQKENKEPEEPLLRQGKFDLF